MSRLPRFPTEAKATGKDLNLILAILDGGMVIDRSSATNSGVRGDGLSPIVPNVPGSVSPAPGGLGAPIPPRGFSGISGIDNFSQSHTAYVVLTWTPNPLSDFVSRYDIYYHKGNDPTLYNVSVGADVNSCRINNLFPATTYSFAIQAHDAANRTSLWSPEIDVVISSDSDAPVTPIGLTATGVTRGVFLTWTEVGLEGLSNDLKQYWIAISTDGGVTYPNVQTVGPGNSWFYSYSANDLATVYFKIATSDWTGNISDYSTPVTATVSGLNGMSGPFNSVSGTYAVLDADYVILADAVGGAFSVTLPTPVGRGGRIFTVKRLNSGANNVTVATAAGLIDGSATLVETVQYQAATFFSNGTNWFIISKA